MKTCVKCKVERPKYTFGKRKRNKDGLQSCCKLCINGYINNYRDTIKGKEVFGGAINRYHQTIKYKKSIRKRALKRKYNITIEDYHRMLEDQGNGCAICGTNDPGGGSSVFRVDHDHKNGKVRGLLCLYCNTILGYSKDDINILTKAIKYLITVSNNS